MTHADYEQSLALKDKVLADKDKELLAAHNQVLSLQDELKNQQAQLEFFKKQLFGPKSERHKVIDDRQLALFELSKERERASSTTEVEIAVHKRRSKKQRDGSEVTEKGLRFDADVPVKLIEHSCAELDGAQADQYEILRYEEVHHLASQPGSKVVLCHRYPVIKHRDSGEFIQPKAFEGVLGQSQVDVSAVADLLIEKFVYHAPLYRQHQKLLDQGFKLSRSTLGNWVQAGIELLRPIADALKAQMREGDYLKLDETPIKAGRTKNASGKGKMKSGWLWPMLGEHGDIAFHYEPSRAKSVVVKLLDGFNGTLQTDGYDVYAKYTAEHDNINHALCWSHTRRSFLKAEKQHPKEVEWLLQHVKVLYRIETELRESSADTEEVLRLRQQRSRRCVDKIFRWITQQIDRVELTPKDPLRKALHYAKDREAGLRVFLADAWVALDTNDLERSLRVIPMGRKNWLFCTSEVGAEHVAIIQTLLATCRAHGVHPYHYLVDVLQRVAIHPASDVLQLTPRQWQKRFANQPIRSPLYSAH